MDNTEILDMEPGPKLDAILAGLFDWDHHVSEYGVSVTRNSDDKPSVFIFNTSTTWEGMRLAIEEMKRRGYEYKIYTKREGGYMVYCTRHTSNNISYAASLPHAVTSASILALMEVSHG